jgi:hypothetical protein
MLIFLLTKLELSDTSGGSIMSTKELFSTALGLEDPWFVKDIKFDSKKRRLEIILVFPEEVSFFVQSVALKIVQFTTRKKEHGGIWTFSSIKPI